MTIHLFVHIPKTAGTSFRLAAADVLGKERIVYDYGRAAPETSELVRKHIYETPDFWAFYQACRREGVAMVGGHMNCDRFVAGFGAPSIVTFIREPLQRIASEFQHFVRHKGYKGSFEEFYSQPKMQNRLSRAFKEVPWWAAGFVGLTERYNESLELLNGVTGLEIPPREENMGKQRVDQQHEFAPKDLKALRQLNRQDIALYRRVVELFEERLALVQQGKPFVHGRLGHVGAHKVSGNAWWAGAGSDVPVPVEVLVNGAVAGTVAATQLQPKFVPMGVPRGGHVGFQMPVDLSDGDQVVCRVAATGQVLGEQVFSPRPSAS